eukprot:226412-Amphidinium_carterae.1
MGIASNTEVLHDEMPGSNWKRLTPCTSKWPLVHQGYFRTGRLLHRCSKGAVPARERGYRKR